MTHITQFPIAEVGKFAIVYYFRFGDRVKIGTTTNLAKRLKSIPHDELIAIEPGSHGTEHMRHLQFANDRSLTGHGREWFKLTPELREHMDGLIETFGEPKTTYVRWAVEHAA